MKIPARQTAYLRRHISGSGAGAVYESESIPFKVHGWSVVRSSDASDEGTPQSWVELYVPDRVVHADTGEDLGPIVAEDLIELPDVVRTPATPATPEQPGYQTGGTNMIQKISLSRSISGTNYFHVVYDGADTVSVGPSYGCNANGSGASVLTSMLNGLPNLSGVLVSGSSTPHYLVTFSGPNAGQTVPLLQPYKTPGYWATSAADLVVSVVQEASPGEWVPPTPAQPAKPPGVATMLVPHYVQGFPQHSDAGLTEWRAGQTLVLMRV